MSLAWRYCASMRPAIHLSSRRAPCLPLWGLGGAAAEAPAPPSMPRSWQHLSLCSASHPSPSLATRPYPWLSLCRPDVSSLLACSRPFGSSPHSPALSRSPSRTHVPRLLQGRAAGIGSCSAHAPATQPPGDTSPSSASAPAPLPRVVLLNTQSGAKEELRPLEAGRVGMYVCGVTVYDYSHIGHARVYVSFDALYRYLLSLGFDVTYVRNFTDVDDKILKRAAEAGEDPLQLSARFIAEFHTDMEQLGCLPPTHEPRVSHHIPDIIRMIATILENGHGYAVEGGDVFFHVPSSPEYGQLSGRKLEENRAGERVEVDARKRHPADFALWKSAKEGEGGLAWDSPWGRGRPGWHIECSAMSARYLGFRFDIHGGGQDLVFPHHENELAQSRAACPECAISSWLHNGFVNIDSEKMSKSLGNFFTIREVLRTYHPMALRWFLLSTHYRSPINFSQRQLAGASDRIFYVYQVLSSSHSALARQSAEQSAVSGGGSPSPKKKKAQGSGSGSGKPSKAALAGAAGISKEAWGALADDFHTGQALAALSEPLRILSDLASPKKKKAPVDTASVNALLEAIVRVLHVLGFPTEPAQCLQILEDLRQLALVRAGLTEAALQALLEERAQARQAKDFARSDVIRDELALKGILLMDGPEGQSWCPSAAATIPSAAVEEGSLGRQKEELTAPA